MDNITKEDIAECIEMIFKAFEDETLKNTDPKTLETIAKLCLLDADDFSYRYYNKTQFPLKQLMKKQFEMLEYKNPYELCMLYMHYNQFEMILDNICTDLEGGCCRGDRSSYLLRQYEKYLKTGIEIDLDITNKEYTFMIPQIGTSEQWLNVLKSIDYQIHGHYDCLHKAVSELKENTKK